MKRAQKTNHTIAIQSGALRIEMGRRYLDGKIGREAFYQRIRRIEVATERAYRANRKYYGDDDSRAE